MAQTKRKGRENEKIKPFSTATACPVLFFPLSVKCLFCPSSLTHIRTNWQAERPTHKENCRQTNIYLLYSMIVIRSDRIQTDIQTETNKDTDRERDREMKIDRHLSYKRKTTTD